MKETSFITSIFSEQQFAKTTLTAERGSFFVVCRDEGDNLVADLFDEGLDQTGGSLHKKKMKIRFCNYNSTSTNKKKRSVFFLSKLQMSTNILRRHKDSLADLFC